MAYNCSLTQTLRTPQITGKITIQALCSCNWVSDPHPTKAKAKRQWDAHKNDLFAGNLESIRLALQNLEDGGLISEY